MCFGFPGVVFPFLSLQHQLQTPGPPHLQFTDSNQHGSIENQLRASLPATSLVFTLQPFTQLSQEPDSLLC